MDTARDVLCRAGNDGQRKDGRYDEERPPIISSQKPDRAKQFESMTHDSGAVDDAGYLGFARTKSGAIADLGRDPKVQQDQRTILRWREKVNRFAPLVGAYDLPHIRIEFWVRHSVAATRLKSTPG